MKRLGLFLAVSALAGGGLTTASAGTDATRTICHRTASKTTPYVKITVSGAGGPVAIPSRPRNASGPARGCAPTTRALVGSLLGDPGSFYVTVHTSAFPAGAIRGQLTGSSSAGFGTVFSLALKGTSEPNA